VRPFLAVTLAASVLGLVACGSQSRVSTPKAPRLPRAVAASLAHRSDVLAQALRRGDGCAATIQLHGLERQTRLAIAAKRIPALYRPQLLAAEQRLARRMPRCVPPVPPPPPPPAPPAPAPEQPKPHGHGHGHKPPKDDHGDHGHHKHGKGD
jgi:uncharacterized membrane protein YccC